MRRTWMMLMMLVLLALPMAGCEYVNLDVLKQHSQIVADESSVLAEAIAAAERARDELDEDIARLPEGEDKAELVGFRNQYDDFLEQAKPRLRDMRDELKALNEKIQQAESERDVFMATGETVSGLIPSPYGPLVGLGVALIGSAWGVIERRRKVQERSAKEEQEQIGRELVMSVGQVLTPQQKKEIKQTPTTKAFVDNVQGKPALRQ